jgi:YD repeat-containing protein
VLGRLTHSQVGTGNRDYGYDGAGNVTTIVDNVYGQTQHFTYDHRDRLVHGWTTGNAGYPPEGGRPGMAYDQWYGYDTIGNLTSRTGLGSYSYGANGNGTGTGPHQARVINGQAYSYDGNGNLVSGGGQSYRWDGANRLASVTSGGVTEYFSYDTDGQRATRTRGSVTTVYLDTQWEETASGAQRVNYSFNGQVVGSRTAAASPRCTATTWGAWSGSSTLATSRWAGRNTTPGAWSAPRPGRC